MHEEKYNEYVSFQKEVKGLFNFIEPVHVIKFFALLQLIIVD